MEDSARASFAGQFHTALGVDSAEAGLAEVLACWASIYEPHATLYADLRAGGGEAAMAVIVQEMVWPRFSGVAFTREPVLGCDEVGYAEWVQGTGDELVSGRGVGGRVWFTSAGRVLRIDYLQGEAPPGNLWPELASHLAQLPALLGCPQDVEWAWADARLYLLQSRPITTAPPERTPGPPPWILPGTPASGWTDEQRRLFDSWDEYNEDPVPPLAFDLYDAAIWQASLDMLAFGDRVPRVEQITVRNEAVPVAVDPAGRVEGVAAAFPRGRNEANVQEMMVEWGNRVRAAQADVAARADVADECLLDLLERVAGWYRDANVTRLLQMNERIEGEDVACAVLAEILAPLGLDPEETVERLCGGVDHETHRRLQALHWLARRLASEGRSPGVEEELGQFHSRYGYVEGFGSPESTNAHVERLSAAGLGVPDPVAQARLRAAELADAIRTRLDEPARERFEQALQQMHHWVALREDSKAQVHLPWPLVQALTAELGSRLLARGVTNKPDDTWLLTWQELQAAVRGQHPAREVLLRRASLLEWKKAHRFWLPPDFQVQATEGGGSVLRGLSGSPGVAEGLGRVVRGPEEFDRVAQGEIVIAHSTNPLWTQIFGRIAGIAVENGSRLSHAAVVAREFGIPAIVGVPSLVKAVTDGERLRVDGDVGEIVRLDWQPPGEET
jgi:pyruvate,water dikinase